MAVSIRTGEEYEKYLNSDRYVEFVFDDPPPGMRAIVDFQIQQFHNVFNTVNIQGHLLLDIGSGPCIQTVISASNHVNEIYLSDYAVKHVARLEKWRRDEMDIQNKMIQRVCELENKGQTVEERVAQIRQKVKQIVRNDITVPKFLTENDVPKQFNVITSSWCFDSVCSNNEEYEHCARNINSLLKMGGHFVVCGSTKCSLWVLDDVKFPMMYISRSDLHRIYEEAGFKIVYYKEMETEEDSLTAEGTFLLAVQKIADTHVTL